MTFESCESGDQVVQIQNLAFSLDDRCNFVYSGCFSTTGFTTAIVICKQFRDSNKTSNNHLFIFYQFEVTVKFGKRQVLKKSIDFCKTLQDKSDYATKAIAASGLSTECPAPKVNVL